MSEIDDTGAPDPTPAAPLALPAPAVEPVHPEAVSIGGHEPPPTAPAITAEDFAISHGPSNLTAAFVHWARSNGPSRRLHTEWVSTLNEFMQRKAR